MPPTSLSQTPFFQHLLSSLPSVRGQIKDAVTASNKQWLLEIRNISAQVGKLALESMEARTRRWRARRDKDPMLRLSRVGSAVEMVTYEKTECELWSIILCWRGLMLVTQTMFWIMTKSKSTFNPCTNAFISIPPSTHLTISVNHIKLTERYSSLSCLLFKLSLHSSC